MPAGIPYAIKMTISITSEKIIQEIQEEFSKLFPFLRIEFFLKFTNKSGMPVRKLSSLLTIGNAFKSSASSEIEVFPNTTVKDFENAFENKFGVYAQLYRKSGNLWQEITITDTWTMKQQDETGSEISALISKQPRLKSRRNRLLKQKAV
jgi:hypothetical protein